MRLRLTLPLLLSVFLGILALASCRKQEKLDTSPSLRLSFSTDTVFFDTVFTTIGSVTQRLTVYNPNEHLVSVSSISLAGGESSQYRININGLSSLSTTNVEIPGHDSIFIFVRVTVDPNSDNAPFVVTDSIMFLTNGNTQDVKLVSWGQNAHYLKSETLNGALVWDSLRPWVIYGYARVDTGASLTLLAGTRVYFHFGASLYVSKDATLKLEGTQDHKIWFQGDRLDPYYRDLPGQWGGIYLEPGSKDHQVDWAVIKNGTTGISADSMPVNANPLLDINNTIIQNMTSDDIYARGAHITGTNLVLGNCGGSGLYAEYGGTYNFRQMTLANYWSASVRMVPALYLTDFTYDTSGVLIINPLVATFFGNSIVYGNLENEIWDTLASSLSSFLFDHCILKTQESFSDTNRFKACYKDDPLLVDPSNYNYHLDSLSPAIGKGIPMGVPVDLDGVTRPETPDLGAYQWVPVR